jgi:hypothetical protein
MSSAVARFDATTAPCGQSSDGERHVTEDREGLLTEDVQYSCGCRSTKEEFHDGSVHRMIVDHRGKVLVDEELRGE